MLNDGDDDNQVSYACEKNGSQIQPKMGASSQFLSLW